MNLLSDILAKLPEISQSRMVNSGYGIWVCWADKLNTAIPQTLSDHGGLKLAEDNKQALWFFLSNEAFRAVARLLIWARLNPMPVFIEIIPAMLLVDYRLNISLSIPPELSNQRSHTPTEFEVLVHPSMQQHVNAIPGLSLIEEGEIAGLGSIAWMKFRADQGLDYESTLKWYGVIKPLGNPADRKFIVGWRSFYNEIQTVLQRLGFKYMGKDEFTVFQVESLRLLRSFCREINLLCKRAKEDKEEGEEESTHYWPAVFACVLQQGMNFNEELPKKVNLDWDKLSPDYPHLRYRSAFLLGEGFRLNDVGYGSSQETVDSWCNVSYVGEGGEMEEEGSLDVFMPRKLFTGENAECLYCGMKNHKEAVCPTRQIARWDANVWTLLAKMDIEDINEGFKELEQELDADNMVQSLEERLEGEDTQSVLTRAVFEINGPSQIRVMKMVWRSRGKDWPEGFAQLSPEGGEYLWSALDIIMTGDLDLAEESLRQASLKYTRSYQPRSLQGIVSLEKSDPDQALFFWQEAERLSYTPLQQGYFLYLQGRLHEVQGEFKEAIELYQKARDISPKWIDPGYRKAVCMVKRGFSEQAVHDFQTLIEKDPNIFNRMLVDPELERGRLHLMGALWRLWLEAETLAKEERKNLEKLTMDVGQWFEDSHDFHEVGGAAHQPPQPIGQDQQFRGLQGTLQGAEPPDQRNRTAGGQRDQADRRQGGLAVRAAQGRTEGGLLVPFPQAAPRVQPRTSTIARKNSTGSRSSI